MYEQLNAAVSTRHCPELECTHLFSKPSLLVTYVCSHSCLLARRAGLVLHHSGGLSSLRSWRVRKVVHDVGAGGEEGSGGSAGGTSGGDSDHA